MTGGVAALRELARYCGAESDRWYAWLAEQDASVLALPVGERQIADVGTLLMHVAWVERAYAEVLVGAPATSEWVAPESVEPARAVHAAAFAKLDAFLAAADDAALDRQVTLRVRGMRLTASAGKMVAHLLVHGIRHDAQLAMKLREQGHGAPGEHDLITGEGFGPPAVFEKDA